MIKMIKMMMRSLLLLLLLAFSGLFDSCAADGIIKPHRPSWAVVHSSSSSSLRSSNEEKVMESPLTIRGGGTNGGPLIDPVVMAKITTGALLAQGVGVLAPQKLCEPYGVGK